MSAAAVRLVSAPDPVSALVISDEWDEHDFLRSVFSDAGWNLHFVSTLRDAMPLLRGGNVPVLLCEYKLPDGSWKGLLERLQHTPRPAHMVVTSRLADEHVWAEVLNLGGFDVLSKPYDRREVRHVIAQAWESWHRHWKPLGAPLKRISVTGKPARRSAPGIPLGLNVE